MSTAPNTTVDLRGRTVGQLIDMGQFEELRRKRAAKSLIAIARRWDSLVDVLMSGDDPLTEQQARDAVLWMATGLVHEKAKDALAFELPELCWLVRSYDTYRTGDGIPQDEGCATVEEALAQRDRQIDLALWPLLTGRPITDACRRCQRVCASVVAWQPRDECSRHSTDAI